MIKYYHQIATATELINGFISSYYQSYRWQVETMSCSQCAVAALLVALTVSVHGYQIIYVDTENGTLNSSCWEGGLDQPCGSLELANVGAQRYNSTIALVLRYGSSRDISTTASTSTQTSSYLSLPATNNGSCNEWTHNQRLTQSSNESCPPWFEQSNGTCKCGKDIHGIVECNETLQESAILGCYCMTYSESTGIVVVGACFYNCMRRILKNTVYNPLPKTVEELNDAMCGNFSRSGQLCGKCKTGYSPLVYSYDLECTMCSGGQYNWIKYVAIAFLPLTVFLVLVLCCRISATSPKLYAFVTFSQALVFPANVRVFLRASNKMSHSPGLAIKLISTLYGFWNLDFFRTFIPHKICLKVDTLQALALDYSIAFYPLGLIIVTYVLIELHDHNFRVIVWIWRPFHRCFARFRQKWDIRASIIDAFATFLILSNIKILSVSLDLLTPTSVYSTNGSVVGLYLYYDASIEYFGKKHLPYAILALFVVLTFIIFPILLLFLYPMRCFQRFLGLCRVRWHALHIFVDAFQGCYKDGTNGTRDCRYFAAVYLFKRLLLCVLFALTHSVAFYVLALFVLIGVAMLLAIVQPYKAEFSTYNAVDSVFMLTLALWYGTVVFCNIAVVKTQELVGTSVIAIFVVGTLPLLYLVVVFLHWICSRRGIGRRVVETIKSQIERVCKRANDTRLEESLPDRLINLHLYQDNEDFYVANNRERFNDQEYSSINHESEQPHEGESS